jgi:hypothetical protein
MSCGRAAGCTNDVVSVETHRESNSIHSLLRYQQLAFASNPAPAEACEYDYQPVCKRHLPPLQCSLYAIGDPSPIGYRRTKYVHRGRDGKCRSFKLALLPSLYAPGDSSPIGYKRAKNGRMSSMSKPQQCFVLLVFLVSATFTLGAKTYESHPRSSTGVRTRTYSAGRSASAKSAGRPYYGGGNHTTSHGGSYPGSVNSSHKYGHYRSPVTGTRTYGRHK